MKQARCRQCSALQMCDGYSREAGGLDINKETRKGMQKKQKRNPAKKRETRD